MAKNEVKGRTNDGYWGIINAELVELQRRQSVPEAFIDGALHRCELKQSFLLRHGCVVACFFQRGRWRWRRRSETGLVNGLWLCVVLQWDLDFVQNASLCLWDSSVNQLCVRDDQWNLFFTCQTGQIGSVCMGLWFMLSGPVNFFSPLPGLFCLSPFLPPSGLGFVSLAPVVWEYCDVSTKKGIPSDQKHEGTPLMTQKKKQPTRIRK